MTLRIFSWVMSARDKQGRPRHSTAGCVQRARRARPPSIPKTRIPTTPFATANAPSGLDGILPDTARAPPAVARARPATARGLRAVARTIAAIARAVLTTARRVRATASIILAIARAVPAMARAPRAIARIARAACSRASWAGVAGLGIGVGRARCALPRQGASEARVLAVRRRSSPGGGPVRGRAPGEGHSVRCYTHRARTPQYPPSESPSEERMRRRGGRAARAQPASESASAIKATTLVEPKCSRRVFAAAPRRRQASAHAQKHNAHGAPHA